MIPFIIVIQIILYGKLTTERIIMNGVFVIFILFVCFIIYQYKKPNKKVTSRTPPPPLDRIRYVSVDYHKYGQGLEIVEKGTLVYEGTVSWDNVDNTWSVFIDNSTFVNENLYKDSIICLDENKNEIPLEGYSFSTIVINQNDCGKLLIYIPK